MSFKGRLDVLAIVLTVVTSTVLCIQATRERDTQCTKNVMFSCKNQTKSNVTCPPWTTPTNDNTCQCGYTENNVVKCTEDNLTALLPFCYCMSYNEHYGTVVGFCAIRCHGTNVKSYEYITPYRYKIPNNISYVDNREKNGQFCSDLKMNRTGQLCGSCKEGFAPPVYSYSFACVNCTDYKYNWLKYIAVAYLPLTIFYCLIITFKFSATSGALNGYIFWCQLVSSPPLLKRYFNVAGVHRSYREFRWSVIVISCVYGIWNLDFFRGLFTPFCIHPNLSTLSATALDYGVALYPFVLIFFTYWSVYLHDHYSFFVRLWTPFRWCFRRFRKIWDIKNSLIEAFATFILLSYVKILNVSLDFLAPVSLFDTNGTEIKYYLRIDGTIEYFGKKHLPYALLALVMTLVFNIIPLVVLFLYPCQCFQRCLNHFNIHSQTLVTFMDVVQGCYKLAPDGERRYFAAFFLLLRISNLLAYSLSDSGAYLNRAGPLALATLFIFAIARPYKKPIYNKLDLVWLLILTLEAYEYPSYVFLHIFSPESSQGYFRILVVYSTLQIFPLLFSIGYLTSLMLPKKVKGKLIALYKCIRNWKTTSTPEESELPYRFYHSDEYPPLIDVVINDSNTHSYQACGN